MSNYAGLYDQNETVKKAKLAAAATASATAAAANNNNNAVTDSGSKTSKKQKLDENNNLQTMATMTATDDWYYTEIPETNCLITERDNDDNDFERQLLQAPSSATKNRYQNQLQHLDYDSDVNNNNPVQGVNTLTISVFANSKTGAIESLGVGETQVQGLDALRTGA